MTESKESNTEISPLPAALPTTFFHGASVTLGIGSIILPGNWGRMIKSAYPAPNNNLFLPYREVIFEYARQALAPTKASRLNCVFVCDTLLEAISFRNSFQPTNVIYEVEPLGDTSDNHVGDFTMANLPQAGQYFGVYDLARQYWLGPVNSPERLLSCPVRVVAAH